MKWLLLRAAPLLVGFTSATQVPLFAPEDVFMGDEWSLDKQPHIDATDHLVFETVASTLQHWAHTRLRNGEREMGLRYIV